MYDLNLRTLGDAIAGDVVLPLDPQWDDARFGFNLAVDLHPAAVVYPADTADVVRVVEFARSRGLRIAPEATGHNHGAFEDMDGLLLVSAERFKSVEIDAENLRVTVGSGVRWSEVVPELSELGLAVLHGSSPTVGIAGYSLGGGMGWLARLHGLQTNAVEEFEVVTASGAVVRASATSEPDLFWALRGGNGNYGFVTSITFRVLPIAEVYGGQMFFDIARAREVLGTWLEMLPGLPDELMTWAGFLRFPDDPEVPEEMRDRAFAIVWGALVGDAAEGERLLAPIRSLGPEIDTFATVPPVGLSDLAMDPDYPIPYRISHALLDGLSPEALDALLAAADERVDMVQMRHMGGALARSEPGAGARATLPGEICLVTTGMADTPEVEAASRRAVAEVLAAVHPHRAGVYPNFVERPADASRFFDGETWERLRAVKAAVDPGDLFRGNHHIPPA